MWAVYLLFVRDTAVPGHWSLLLDYEGDDESLYCPPECEDEACDHEPSDIDDHYAYDSAHQLYRPKMSKQVVHVIRDSKDDAFEYQQRAWSFALDDGKHLSPRLGSFEDRYIGPVLQACSSTALPNESKSEHCQDFVYGMLENLRRIDGVTVRTDYVEVINGA